MSSSILPLALGLGSAVGGVASAAIGANAAGNASKQQVTQEQNALDYTKQTNAPFVSAGQTSIGQLMSGLQNGTFGPGSVAPYTLPTAADAQATPGYQFTQQQGELGVERGAAASGGAFTGGTLKALAGYDAGLANTTYQNTVSNSLAGYQANLTSQAQQYNQLLAPATLGQGAAAGTSANVSNLLTNIGSSEAAGTVGSANAITSGITGATNGLSQAAILQGLINNGGFGGGGTGPAPLPPNYGGASLPGGYTIPPYNPGPTTPPVQANPPG